MKILKIIIIFLWLMMLSLAITEAKISHGSCSYIADGLEINRNEYQEGNVEMDLFFEAKRYVFTRKWAKASRLLQEYLDKYPNGQLPDEAMYWLGQCKNKLSRQIKNPQEMIQLKEEAIDNLNMLIREFKKSIWLDDALTLRVEIAGELVFLGKTKYQMYITEAVKTNNRKEWEIKFVALTNLMESDPRTAITLLEKLLKEEQDREVKKKALLLLGRNYSLETVRILEGVLKDEKNPGVKAEASYWLNRVKTRLIPVQLNYYVFTAKLTDPNEKKRIKDSYLKPLNLKRGQPGDKAALKKKVEAFFNGKLSWFTTQATSRGGILNEIYSVSHSISGTNIRVLNDSIEKKSDQINGMVLFHHLKTGQKDTAAFSVDSDRDQLFVLGKEDKVTLLILQFESTKESTASLTESSFKDSKFSYANAFDYLVKLLGLQKNPIYHIEHSNIMGCKVLTTLNSMDLSRLKGKKIDFAEAKAEIPGPNGKWILKGFLLLLEKEKKFLARKGMLINPQGEVVAVGLQLDVPIGSPHKYKVLEGGNKLKDFKKPVIHEPKSDAEPVYHSHFNLREGVKIFSSRQSFSLQDLRSKNIDFGLSKVKIKGKENSSWVLTGYLKYSEAENNIIAGQGTLTCYSLLYPEGKTVAKDKNISIPLDHPEKFKILGDRYLK